MRKCPSTAAIDPVGQDAFVAEPRSSRRGGDETWFFEPEACREILRRNDFSARRSSAGSRFADAPSSELAEFFGGWLMYSEGARHRSLRALAAKALRRLQGRFEAPTAEHGAAPRAFDLVADYCIPFVWNRSARLFEVSESQRRLWLPHLTLLCSLPGIAHPSREQLSLATDSLRILRASIDASGGFGLLSVLQDEARGTWDRATLIDLSINLVGDGFHPTVAALATELWLRSRETPAKVTSGSLRFHEDPPFQYIARTARCDTQVSDALVRRKERVVACVAAANRAQLDRKTASRPLTFGLGRHNCVGRVFAEQCLTDGVSEFERWSGRRDLFFQEPVWIDSAGYRAMKSCDVSGSPQVAP